MAMHDVLPHFTDDEVMCKNVGLQGLLYILQEFCSGGDLRTAIVRDYAGELSWNSRQVSLSRMHIYLHGKCIAIEESRNNSRHSMQCAPGARAGGGAQFLLALTFCIVIAAWIAQCFVTTSWAMVVLEAENCLPVLLPAAPLSTQLPHCVCRGQEIGLHVALGLEYLHANGILHFDIKSRNVLLTADGVAKLADGKHSSHLCCGCAASVPMELLGIGELP